MESATRRPSDLFLVQKGKNYEDIDNLEPVQGDGGISEPL